MTTTSLQIYPSNCEACRKRRCKCNRIKPCSNCQLRGLSDECYATVPERRAAAARRTSSNVRRRNSTSPRRRQRPTVTPAIDSLHQLPLVPSSTTLVSTPSTSYRVDDQHSVEEALRLLSSVPANTPVKWRDVNTLLPTAAHCHQLFCFYFDELLPDVSFIDKTSLLERVETLWQIQGSITRQEAAIVFWILTHSCLNIPSKHPLRSTVLNLTKTAEQCNSVASALQTPLLLHMSRYEMLLDACLDALEALWLAFNSNFEAHWQATGAGIRRCAALHLFSSRQKGSVGKHHHEISINTTHLTQKLLVMDRWVAFTDLRAYGVHPSDVEERETSAEVLCLRAWIEGIQIELLEIGRDFVLHCERDLTSREDLCKELRHVLERINVQSDIVVRRYTSETAISLDPVHCTQGDSGVLAAVLVSWLAACAFIGCSVAMPFACDLEASMNDRLASLRCASNLMSLVPILSSIYQNGIQALRITRLSNHLFYALRAVILTLTGLDVQPSVTTRQNTEALLLGRTDWSRNIFSSDSSSSPCRHVDDIALIQEQFHNSMGLLELFSADGNRTAKRALNLVEGVLNSNKDLATTLAWTGSMHTEGTVDKSREAFATEWSLAKSGTVHVSPSTINLQDNQPSSSSSSQTAIDAMLWQSPQINFLRPEDIERILASFG